MLRSLLSLCLVLAACAPNARRAFAGDTTTLTKQEKVAFAVLGQVASHNKIRSAKASRLFARLPDASKAKPLTMALTVEPARLRIFAAGELARLGEARAAAPLLTRVLREPVPAARRALAEAAGRLRAPRSVAVLVAALRSRGEVVRRRAAEALGHLGDRAALPYLIATWEARSGAFPRSYVSHTGQVGYIADYEVEVA